MIEPPSPQVLAAFGLQGQPVFLPGGEGRTYKVDNGILKYVNPDATQYAYWIADIFSQIEENGFRVSRPLMTAEKTWLTVDSWSAWTLVEGTHSSAQNVSEVITAIQAFHLALQKFPQPDFYTQIVDNEYGRADAAAWGSLPAQVLPEFRVPIETLYSLCIPVSDLTEQLIHGDLNPENILVAPNMPPAIIDLAPYFRPPEFALAVYAYWIGPWRGNVTVLENFAHINHFKQMLIRAALRMLLIASETKKADLAERYLQATELVRKYVTL